MNKTVRKIVSLVVALTFALSMMTMPAVFAEGLDLLGGEHWTVKLYSDEACEKEITALAPDQTAYAQLSLEGLRYFGSIDVNLKATNLVIEEIVSNDILINANEAMNAADIEKYEAVALTGKNVVSEDGLSANVFYRLKLGQSYSDNTNKVFTLNGANETTPGKELKIVTLKVKAGSDFSGEAKIEVDADSSGLAGIRIGQLEYGDAVKSDISAGSKNLAAGLPTVSDAKLVEGADGTEAITDPIETTDGKDPIGAQGANYYFHANLTNGTDKHYQLINSATMSAAGAYINVPATEFDLADGATADKPINDVPVTIHDPILASDYTAATVDFVVLATQYRINPEDIPTIELPRGITAITAADLGDSVQTSNDGTTWTTVDLTGKTIALDPSFTNNGESITVGTETDVVVTISDITLQEENNKVTIKTVAPTANGKYQLAASAENPYVVYKATISAEEIFAQPLNLETGYSDGTFVDEDATTATEELTYTITADNWKAFVDAANAADGDYTGTVAVAFNNADVIADGSITITAKDAEPTGNYRVKAGQTFSHGYKGAVDTSKILFEQEVIPDPAKPEETQWVDYTPAGYTVVLSSYDNTVAGSNTVTVSLVGDPAITLDPATITVNVTKEIASYAASWIGGTPAAVTGMSEAAIKELIAIEATYADSGVKELIPVVLDNLTIAGYDNTSTAAQTLTITYDGKAAGTLSLTLADAAATYQVSANVEIAGVEVVGAISGTVTAATEGETPATVALTYGLSGNDAIKVMGNVANTTAAGDYAFTLSIPGFKPVSGTLHVTADAATIEIAEGAQLLAGFVASTDGVVADKATISNHDFYAIGAHLGESTSGNDAIVKYDLNRDGKITQLDIDAMLSNYGA